MKIIRPETISNKMLVSTNIVASTLNEYNKATTYTSTQTVKVSYQDGNLPAAHATTTAYILADRVIPATHNGFIYVCSTAGTSGGSAPTWPTIAGKTVTDGTAVWTCQAMVAPVKEYTCQTGGTNHYPPDDDGTYWIYTGAENAWNWGDSFIGTQTEADGNEATDAGEIVMVLKADRCTAVGLFGMVGQTYQVDRYDSSDVLLSTTGEVSLPNAAVYGDLWSYFFEDFVYSHDIIVEFGIRNIQTIKITIKHNTAGGYYPAIGYALVGRVTTIGETRWEAQTGITSFAKKQTNETFGYTYLAPGNTSKYMDIDVLIDTADYDRIQKTLESVDAIPTIFWGNNTGASYQALNILGWYHDFNMTLKGPVKSECKLEIKGLT
jgi:hypothetical protein